MTVDVLIAGGGIAGLLLARALRARGQRVLVANDPARPAAAQAAVGLLNPVLGPRFTLAWEAAATIPVARATYTAISQECARGGLFRDVPLVRVLRDTAQRVAWGARAADIAAAGLVIEETDQLPRGFRAPARGAIMIRETGVVDAWAALDALRRQLLAAGAYVDLRCAPADLELTTDLVTWSTGGITARALVLAGGVADATPGGNVTYDVTLGRGPALPLRAVKGETVLVRAPELAEDAVVINGHFLAPRGDGRWVCGATQDPDIDDSQPTGKARAEFEAFLSEQIGSGWTIEDQRAGVRAVTPDLRPVAGRWVPSAPVYVFNGFGSRGFATGPWLAERLAAHLVDGAELPDGVAPERFAAARKARKRG